MPSRVFTLDQLEDYGVDGCNEYKEGCGARRWSESFDVVFRADDDQKLYHVVVEEGLTENQDYCDSDRYPDMSYTDKTVTCAEVELYEELVPVTRFRFLVDPDATA